ncbi:von Willebrand factor type A domain-containing protein [Hygrophoropsis aurantiaca]|uniref:von Willebrand factor type A domain-containing protein n=1 Tax=Hygrophoropsis aurantiaca TaxID=72124 RepID=A0ACB8A6J9_9AGAM|nr:von Willebrand factor type A domain-containing protein [Hygrophoropsis aurantiaca]
MTSGRYYHLAPPTCVAISSPVTEFVPGTSHNVSLSPPSNSLTLKECVISACIIDTHSRVTLSQRFENQSDREAGQVTYTFSMLASAAVCDFEMVRQDGTNVVGVVKEKEQARAELEMALAAGHTAALGEEQTKDIFSICIGNVLPQEMITINLTYINTLIDDESPNQVRFTLPRVYMQRYGVAPEGRIYGSVGHKDVPFTMDVSIQQTGRIRSVTCPSGFSLTVNLGRPDYLDPSVGPDANFATVNVRRTNTSAPSQDVIIVITADGLDAPRAVIERHPVHQTAAIGLTLVPHFKPIESPLGMEYIFLVDRSGSMSNGKMNMARTAHTVLLQGLPSRNTIFNIFSFGSRVSSLWPVSRTYDQDSVDTAMSHIETMQANYGGTQMAKALEAVYKSLVTPLVCPVSIFLLADGGVWDVSCVNITQEAIREYATDAAFIRVFTIGLG